MRAIQGAGRVALLAVAGLALLQASDFTGIYARIDKVVLEPNADSPERIQVWGVFSLATSNRGSDYEPAARGYLYFKLSRDPRTAQAEWNDLKAVAGTKQIVAFGMRGAQLKLRKADEKPDNPDFYPTNIGVNKINGRTDYPPVRSLLEFKD